MTTNTKKIMKIITALMVVVLIVSAFSTVFAETSYDPTNWNNQQGGKIEDGDTKAWIASIMNIIAIVGSGIAVIALIVLGIKYMMGSVEEKAEYKKTMLPYLIGALFVFGASAIVAFIASAVK